MKDNKFRITVIFSLIIIIISLNIEPSISRDTKIISSILSEDATENFSMNSESLLAYWSFNTGSGYIAYDYSGHGYDGIIQGASWTSGYSSYALDFDGNYDQVNFNTYSERLGFNKTDDYKISVWINSTSNNKGIIYQMSDQNDLYPSAYVRLNSDGTLETKVQSTASCDVEVISDESYNDGLWHFVECIYHGDSYDPTLELYVDEEFVDSNTDWLCPMSFHQFKKAKIGIASYDSIEPFEGIIDEVKVYKKTEENQPPNEPIIDGPTIGTVGEEYNYTFISTDPDGDNISYWVDWGDGNTTGWIGPYSSNEEVKISYAWSKNGTYEIRAKVKDTYYDMSDWSTLIVIMGNLPPEAPIITGPTNGEKGNKYEFTFISIDQNGHDIKYYIDWGDGSNSGWTDYYSSGAEVTLSHKWSEQGMFIVKAKAKDIYNAESEWSELFIVNITQKAILYGFITNMTSNGEFTTFNAKLLLYLGLNPFTNKFYSSGEKIMISNEYLGMISERLIFGIFNTVIN